MARCTLQTGRFLDLRLNSTLPPADVLAFAITWAPTPFGIFMAAGPLLAALVVTAVVDGRGGLRELGNRLLRWRVGWQWYAAALLIPLAIVLGTGGLNVALGAADAPLSTPPALLARPEPVAPVSHLRRRPPKKAPHAARGLSVIGAIDSKQLQQRDLRS
jgi:hypothetical protein